MNNKSSQSPLLIGIVVVVLLAAVAGDMIYSSLFQSEESVETSAELPAEADQATEVGEVKKPEATEGMAEPEAAPEPAAEVKEQTQEKTEASSTTSDAVEENITLLFQTVRVDSDGAVVIAGVGSPSQEIEILLNGELYETVKADSQGNFASLFDLPYSEAVRILSLRSIVNGKMIVSDQDAIIAPAQIAAPAVPEPSNDPVAESDDSEASTVIAKADLTEETESQAAEGAKQSDETADAADKAGDSIVVAQADEGTTEPAQSDAAPKDTAQIQTASEQEVIEEDQSAKPVEIAESASRPSEQTQVETAVATEQSAEELADAEPAVSETAESETVANDTAGEAEVVTPAAATDALENASVETASVAADEQTQKEAQKELASVSTKDSADEPEVNEVISDPDTISQEVVDKEADEPKAIDVAQSTEAPEVTKEDITAAADSADTAVETAQVNEDATKAVETETVSTAVTKSTETGPLVQEEQAPTVMIADEDGVRVVQSGQDPADSDVALDAISYDEKGDVALSGRGTPAAQVLVYLDNAPISSTVLDSAGQWKTHLTDVDPGVYTLRIDQLDTSGKVVSRLETPFQREDRERLVEQVAASAEPARVNVVTVQPGYTLWAIARTRYGRGILYVQVFEANRDKIRDPDLIYPGQVFQLPD